jgi:hypothetical protein
LATKLDVTTLQKDVADLREETRSKQAESEIRLTNVEKSILEMREELRSISSGNSANSSGGGASNASTAGSTATSFATAGAKRVETTNWVPKTVFVRGFAPFGCNPTEKIQATDTRVFQEKLIKSLPTHIRMQTTASPPFAINHQVCFTVVGGRNTFQAVAAAFNDHITAHEITIKGKKIRASVEVSEQRKALSKNFFGAIEFLKAKSISEDKYTICAKGLRIYATETFEEIGCTPIGASAWRWNEAICKTIGFEVNDGSNPADY